VFEPTYNGHLEYWCEALGGPAMKRLRRIAACLALVAGTAWAGDAASA
jgi:hypothetical protein